MKIYRILLSIILLSALLLFNKCFVFHIASLEEQSYKSPEVYNHYLSELNYDTSYSFQLNPCYFDSLTTLKYGLNKYKIENNSPGFSATQIRFYDKTGMLISGYEQCFGPLRKIPALLDTFPMRSVAQLPVNFSLNLENDLKWVDIPEDEMQSITGLIESSEYTIILAYSIWTGWFSKQILEVFQEYLSQYNDEEYFLILVNFDVGAENYH